MKKNHLPHWVCIIMLLLVNRANSQTFSKGFELLTGTQQSSVYNVYDTYGPNNVAPNLRPFSVWGTGMAYGQGAYLIGDGQFNAHSGSNLFSFSAQAGNNCLGLLASCPLEDNKTYKISFWAASWTVLQRNAELASPILAIKRPNATWLVGTAEISATDVDTFYPNASSGSYATWANDTGNYYSVGTNWTSTTASYNGTLTWTKYEHTFTNVGSNTTISICNTVQQSSAILALDDISCEEVIVPCTPPNFIAETSKASCTGSSPNTDAKLLISSISNGDKVAYSEGLTYAGTADYSTATLISALSPAGQVVGNLTNPASSQQYTIRVYNGNNGCYTDQVTTLLPKTCVSPCGTPQCRSIGIRVN